eukprot:CAMPEP_0184654128 /NCGR_PEP_ID=MMETSP0308-20130426/11837_1 /TAXON_ID=38269 /ORGANISM="Gloeochaete witrockiana, Strain SAG 46.84" /LENGTH=305 /DNA_ID=CAMNT_0027089973 /DNA_START=3 /DNA_END=920 /DNA_ORIENTATION=-
MTAVAALSALSPADRRRVEDQYGHWRANSRTADAAQVVALPSIVRLKMFARGDIFLAQAALNRGPRDIPVEVLTVVRRELETALARKYAALTPATEPVSLPAVGDLRNVVAEKQQARQQSAKATGAKPHAEKAERPTPPVKKQITKGKAVKKGAQKEKSTEPSSFTGKYKHAVIKAVDKSLKAYFKAAVVHQREGGDTETAPKLVDFTLGQLKTDLPAFLAAVGPRPVKPAKPVVPAKGKKSDKKTEELKEAEAKPSKEASAADKNEDMEMEGAGEYTEENKEGEETSTPNEEEGLVDYDTDADN